MLSKRKILLIILVIVTLFSLNKFGKEEIRNTFYLISSPFSKGFWKAGQEVSEFFGTIFEIKTLKEENKELLKENLGLLQELVSLRKIQEENTALREVLGLELQKKFEFSLVEVISRELDRDFILISGGEKDGIFEKMPVITQEQVLVGKVKEVFANFSKVRLISARDWVFDIEIQAAETVLGIAKGKGNLKIEFQLVPKENQIKKGDVAITTTLGGNFPKGLLVGEIAEVRKSDVEPYQEGIIKPYFAIGDLRILFVIKNFESIK